MTHFTFVVTVADGNDFTHDFTSTVTVAADTTDAKLLATQLALTPMFGKPGHMQVTGVHFKGAVV